LFEHDLFRKPVPTFRDHAFGRLAGTARRLPAPRHDTMSAAMSDSENAKRLFFEALALMDASNFPDAELRLREALRLAPTQGAVLTNLAIVLAQQNKRAEARGFAEQAVAIDPKNIEALLVLADCHLHDERFMEALAACDRILALEPDLAEIHSNRGLALERLGRPADALAAYERTLALTPDVARAWLGRGNALGTLKRFDEALNSYDRALALQPGQPEAWLGRGNALCDLKRHDDALAAFDKALALDPKLAAAWFGRGNVFYDRKNFIEALAAYDRALALDPGLAGAWLGRGDALRFLKRTSEAIAAYRQALASGADAESIQFYLAGLGAEPSPPTSPTRFVTNLFDSYADNFEHDLVVNLKYHSPDVLAGTIRRYAPSNELDTLDLGCGTGLMGNLLRPISRTLTGVDLSENMLEKARQRQIYDRLVCGDLIEFLHTLDKSYDLAVATDVFIYVGDLSPVFPAVRRSLGDGGLFCFSVEAADGNDGPVLRNTMRYAHSAGYLRNLAAQHRFAVESIEPQVIRRGVEGDIAGYHVVMRAIDPPSSTTT
jgi:predicted TPR repeat methyltransferase